MEIRRLKIRRFRGIESLTWDIDGPFACLIGPGDSTKSTILDAIDLVLAPRRNVTLDDTDFHNADVSSPLLIEVTVTGVPDDLLSDAKFGYLIRGWCADGIHDEPYGGDIPALTVRLNVDQTLEPTWIVVNDRQPEGKRISHFDRQRFALCRIGTYADWQLTWGPDSALTRLMESRESVHALLADARRKTREAISVERLPLLQASATAAQGIAKDFGIAPQSTEGFVPRLDVRNVGMGASLLALHDGPVPLRQAGRGTSRLLTLGLQHEAGRERSITLIDEVEYGLEPHRLRKLLHVIRTGSRLGHPVAMTGREVPLGQQVFLTSHSPVAVSELEPQDLRVVRSEVGVTEVRKPSARLRPLLRRCPDAFLARNVIVCEGRTELGICRALDDWWSSLSLGSFAYAGTALADGNGTEGPQSALDLAELGYRVAFLGDSDRDITPSAAALAEGGVQVILWPGGKSTEGRLLSDLPWEGVLEMARIAIQEWGLGAVRGRAAKQLGVEAMALSEDPSGWAGNEDQQAGVRDCLAAAAKAKGWYKRVDIAQRVGELIATHWTTLSGRPAAEAIVTLRDWLYGGSATASGDA